MEIKALVACLTDEDTRVETEKFLAERGSEVLPALLAELADPESEVDTWCALWHVGEPAFDPLTELLATAPGEIARRVSRAFTGLHVPRDRYLATVGHPSPAVRRSSVGMMHKEDGLRNARALAPFLADSDPHVQREALYAFGSMGREVLPLLHEVRATAKGELRRRALVAQMEVGGTDVLTEADRVVLQRFLRIAAEEDQWSYTPMSHLCGGWLALRTENQQAVLEVCGLSDAVPVTKEIGAAAWSNDHHTWARADEHVRCARAYVSPAFDGWTLVFGEPFAHAGRSVPELCAVLSAAFGEAHHYGTSCGDSWNAWCIAEDGDVLRYYDAFSPDKAFGDLLEVEEGKCLPHEVEDLEDCWATDVAQEMSHNPADDDWDGDLEGQGVLALTLCGRTHGSPRGALLT